ncbi:MAG TPA: DoxX family membrane protein [Deltaproteobacteria bacterium]|nr:DoxX family membrane protein [Deltaproteobacteria bacterium]
MLELPRSRVKRIALFALSAFFLFAGIQHFANPDFFTAIVPPALPDPLMIVYVSGLFEIAGGIGVLIPRVRSLAGWGLVALLIAVFPANLYMAMNPELFPELTPTKLYVRLPFQFLFIAWAWWATRDDASGPSASGHEANVRMER